MFGVHGTRNARAKGVQWAPALRAREDSLIRWMAGSGPAMTNDEKCSFDYAALSAFVTAFGARSVNQKKYVIQAQKG